MASRAPLRLRAVTLALARWVTLPGPGRYTLVAERVSLKCAIGGVWAMVGRTTKILLAARKRLAGGREHVGEAILMYAM